MVKCPICGKEHKKMLYMSIHMILFAIYHRGDDHGRYLDLLTGKDFHFWGRKNDAAVAKLLLKYHQKLGHLPTLQDLEEAHDNN